MTDLILIPRELFAFLCGDGPMQGHWFGEKPEHERGNFWWRKALRAADNSMVDAETIKGIIRAWLALDDPSAWGDFEKALDAAISDPPTLQRLGQEFDAGEAVAWMYEKGGKEFVNQHNQPWKSRDGWKITPLYAHPPQSRVAAEPVGQDRNEAIMALTAKFGPILKAAFPNEHSRTRFDVANALAEVALATPSQPGPQPRGQAFDGEGEELAEAVRCIMARCEALEDEASNGIATTTANGRDEAHEAGFWRGQKSTAKSIREHLHDMTRAALSSAKRGEADK